MFIDEKKIKSLIENAKQTSENDYNAILDKAESYEQLTLEEVAALLMYNGKTERLFEAAKKIKEHIYGSRLVLFAPLYISDYCINKCAYCGFRCDNKFDRRRLSMDEIREEVRILESMGHKRIALEAGEHPAMCSIEYIVEAMQTVYDMKFENGAIRRINVNIAADTVENYKKLSDVGIGTYVLFQETYNRTAYEAFHLSGPKADYEYHLTAFDRAMEAGIDDVGAGVLFGLYDPKFEVLGLMMHNKHLEEKHNVGFHTISIPRLCAADGVNSDDYKHILSDDEFLRIVAIIRIAVPFTGMLVSTRESQEMREKLMKIGVSQISAGSSVEVGGYSLREKKGSQFEVSDHRDARDIIKWVMETGNIPSFCTACYRSGRTGDRFMELAKSGNIKNVCLPNALMTLAEYAQDYGDAEAVKLAENVISSEINKIENETVRRMTAENIGKINNGERDLFI